LNVVVGKFVNKYNFVAIFFSDIRGFTTIWEAVYLGVRDNKLERLF